MQLPRRPNKHTNLPQISSLFFPISSSPLSHNHAHHLCRRCRILFLLSSHFSCVSSFSGAVTTRSHRAQPHSMHAEARPVSSKTPIANTLTLHLRRPNDQANLPQISSLLFPPSSSPLSQKSRPPSPPLPPPLHFVCLDLPLFLRSINLRRRHHAHPHSVHAKLALSPPKHR
jgi:hypothetical protein